MPNDSPLSIFSTSNVHCLISPPSPPKNLKIWIVQSENLFKIQHLGQSNQAMKNNHLLLKINHFLLQMLLLGIMKMCIFTNPKNIHNIFFVNLCPKNTIKANLLLSLACSYGTIYILCQNIIFQIHKDLIHNNVSRFLIL